ncbi:MAG: glutathione synthase [Deltaproteobacteria bacterium]
MRLAVIMDPIENVLVDKDTSFALMLAAQKRGHEVLYLSHRELWVDRGTLRLTARPVTLDRVAPPAHARLGAPVDLAAEDVDAILIRTDPPFDDEYSYTTQLLELVRGRTLVINDPRGLRDANEKLYALHFADVMPPTIVTHHAFHIRSFIDSVGGRGMIKPLDGAGGRGMMVLDRKDLNFNAIIETVTANGTKLCMVQEFLPAVRQGDKRVLLLDGEPLGAILRVPRDDEARSNIHVGGRVEPTTLTPAEEALVKRLAPRLRADGLYFVGLDVIGEKLTEVNVTSPTGIQELSRHTGSEPEARVIRWIEERVAQRKK